MSAADYLAHPAGRVLTLVLLHFLWQGAAIAALLAVAVELLRMRRASSRYAASLAALLAMLAAPLATAAWLGSSLLTAPASVELDGGAWMSALPIAGSAAAEGAETWLADAQPYALAAWLAGVALFGGRLLVGAAAALALGRGRQPLPLELASVVEHLGRRLHIGALPLVFISSQAREALAVGLVRPLVLLPASWVSEMPIAVLEAVIAHELAHIARRDLWVNLLQRLIETLLFYHPAVWWLSQRLRRERELCADELAAAALSGPETARRLAYAQALEHVAARRQAEVGPLLAAFMRGGSNMRLLERVQHVLRVPGGEPSRAWPAGIAAMGLPLLLWALSLGLAPATADDDREVTERPRIEREDRDDARYDGAREERRHEEREERDDRDEPGDRDDDDRNEGERRERDVEREKPRPRDGEARKFRPRDGEIKKPGPRDGELKKSGLREGEKLGLHGAADFGMEGSSFGMRDGEVKRPGPREGQIKKRGRADDEIKKPLNPLKLPPEKVIRKEGVEDARIDELAHLVKQLSAQVERLQAEVRELRGNRGDRPRKPSDDEAALLERHLDMLNQARAREAQEREHIHRYEEMRRQVMEKQAAAIKEALRQREEAAAAAAKAAAEAEAATSDARSKAIDEEARARKEKEALSRRQKELAERIERDLRETFDRPKPAANDEEAREEKERDKESERKARDEKDGHEKASDADEKPRL